MTYVFDTTPFVTLFRNFYKSRFPTLWGLFDARIESGEITSTREVFRELEEQDDTLLAWARAHRDVFVTPDAAEGAFVAQIYAVPHFQQNIEKQKLLKGGKNADAFVTARAAVLQGCVVMLEKRTPNAAKIPNICDHFGIQCLTLEEFMEAENWSF